MIAASGTNGAPWLRNVQVAGVPIGNVEVVPRPDAEAALVAIGGKEGETLQKRAREMERAIYRISAALAPPGVKEIDQDAVAASRPFGVIESFRIDDGKETLTLRPLVIFDDAHSLHPAQLVALRRWLVRRELKVARWILTPLNAHGALRRRRRLRPTIHDGGDAHRPRRRFGLRGLHPGEPSDPAPRSSRARRPTPERSAAPSRKTRYRVR